MNKFSMATLLVLILLALLGLPEVVLLDFLIPQYGKKILLSLSLITTLACLILFWSRNIPSVFISVFLLGFACVVTSVLFRLSFLYPVEISQEIISLVQYLLVGSFCLLLLLFSKYQGRKFKMMSYGMKFSMMLVPLSFVLYMLLPMIVMDFYDYSGHYIRLVYFSFSSSINNISGLSFPRLSLIFDEPGTFGVFVSFALAFFLGAKEKDFGMIFLLVFVGLFSLSMSFYIVVSAMLLIFVILQYRNSVKKWVFSASLIVLIMITLSFLFEGSVLAEYVSGRISDILSGKHNRSVGNNEALEVLGRRFWGVNSNYYENRYFPSSGIFVVGAYRGWLYVLSFLALYSSLLLSLRYKGESVVYLAVAMIAVLFTRNNLFNVSGAIILVFSYVFFVITRRSDGKA